MRKFFPSLFFACFVSIVLAQNNLSRVYAITTDTALIGTLTNNYWQMLEDKDGKSPIADKFHYDSLSYDIIKAHGGEIKVETKEDESAKFIIMLPSKENL